MYFSLNTITNICFITDWLLNTKIRAWLPLQITDISAFHLPTKSNKPPGIIGLATCLEASRTHHLLHSVLQAHCMHFIKKDQEAFCRCNQSGVRTPRSSAHTFTGATYSLNDRPQRYLSSSQPTTIPSDGLKLILVLHSEPRFLGYYFLLLSNIRHFPFCHDSLQGLNYDCGNISIRSPRAVCGYL